jgi:hypothetical protein
MTKTVRREFDTRCEPEFRMTWELGVCFAVVQEAFGGKGALDLLWFPIDCPLTMRISDLPASASTPPPHDSRAHTSDNPYHPPWTRRAGPVRATNIRCNEVSGPLVKEVGTIPLESSPRALRR